ncbi:MAG: hypothetical protein QOK39_2331 [Acidimicrobiaceae bacterium]|nr:hypothetical protein [Acidimicrobiaceae bacterium]
MTVNDPWAILGLVPGSSLAEARAARRRLAKALHPDLHAGRPVAESAALAARMTEVNLALAAIEHGGLSTAPARPAAAAATKAVPATQPDPTPRDDTFSVDRLPAEAFEALFLAAYALGDILVADEPYLLELYLLEPAPCFCRVTLVPEAGGSIVTVDVSPARDGGTAPETAAVVDVLIAELNALVIG